MLLKTIAITLLLMLCGCSGQKNQPTADFPDDLTLRKGDVVFREGIGFTSHIIQLMDAPGVYTHTGIVTDSAGHFMVIHAVPDEPDFKGDPDRVKMEPIAEFYGFGKAKSGAVMRADDSAKAALAADIAYRIYKRGTLFDHQYDDSDTTEMYCSELVSYAFRQAGLPLVGDTLRESRFSGKTGRYLFPSDIFHSQRLKTIKTF